MTENKKKNKKNRKKTKLLSVCSLRYIWVPTIRYLQGRSADFDAQNADFRRDKIWTQKRL